jgi:outer membrane lipoprotein-sorting protein
MKNMKALGVIILLSNIWLLGVSFKDTTPDPKQLFEASQATVKAFKSYEIAYKATLEYPDSDLTSYNGVMKIKGVKYQNKYKNPEDIIVHDNGEFHWLMNKTQMQVSIMDYDDHDDSLMGLDYYTFSSDAGKFEYKGSNEENHIITLYQKNEESEVWKYDFWISKSTQLVTKSKVYYSPSITITCELTYQNTNVNIPDTEFEMDLKQDLKGYEVVDFRNE